MGGRRFLTALLAVTALALILRLVAAHTLAPEAPSGDSFYFHAQANLLADGHWFKDPYLHEATGRLADSSVHPPLYVMVLAAASTLGLRSVAAHLTVSCLLGAAAVTVLGLLARRLGGDRAGLVAAVIAALHPNLWLHDTTLMSEPLYLLLLGLALLASVHAWREASPRAATLLGLAVGAAVLTRGEAVFLVPLLVWPVFLRPGHRRWRGAAVATAVAITLVAPWTAWNSIRFGQLVPVAVNAFEVLAYANSDATYHGDHLGYWQLQLFPGNDRGNEAQRAAVTRSHGLEYVRGNLDRLPVVVAARVGGTFGAFRPLLHVRFGDHEGRDRAWGLAGMWAYLALLPLGALGVVRLRRTDGPTWPLLAPWAMVLLTSITIYGAIRFRLAAEVSLVVLAAVGMAGIRPTIDKSERDLDDAVDLRQPPARRHRHRGAAP